MDIQRKAGGRGQEAEGKNLVGSNQGKEDGISPASCLLSPAFSIHPEIAALINNLHDLEKAKQWLKELYLVLSREEVREYIEPTELW